MARKKQSARLAEAQQERAAAEEKRKRKHEAAAKEVQKDSKVFDPPPAPLMEPSGSKGPTTPNFALYTENAVNFLISWSSGQKKRIGPSGVFTATLFTLGQF